ncbi:hypothetical protein LWI29_006575 [Acer saccharum]|uniref:Uncharacterized protein n=1 Tax=Acer saccharum TaxID=4024 RepID=A0AA39RYG3_ACESA|nr:hypothetical protein LWI29_006575 [Acer saccharum]
MIGVIQDSPTGSGIRDQHIDLLVFWEAGSRQTEYGYGPCHHNICFLSDSSDKELRFKGKSDNSNNKFVDTETEQSRLELTHRVTLLAEVASGFLFFFSLEPVVDF